MLAIRQGRQRASNKVIYIILFLITILIFTHFFQVQQYKQIPVDHCRSELAHVKYQLDNISEYKKKMDALLHGLQEEYEIQWENLQNIINGYKLMKSRLYTCELQTEELEAECMQIKEKLRSTTKELETYIKPTG